MKKLLSIVMIMMLVLGMSTVAFADTTAASKAASYDAVIKAYTVTGATDDSLFPAETLKFTSVAATTNPDGGDLNLTIDDLVVTGNTNQKLKINVPSFTKVGTYHFTISETEGATQGVTYTGSTIDVSVLVTYDYEDADNDGYTMTATVGITQAEDDSKNNQFTNEYDLGALDVTKTVTGNLGDKNKEFTVHVTFNAAEKVKSDITYVDGTETKTITADAMADGTETVEITVKDGETVSFTNIPAGVTYTVEEDAAHLTGDINGEEGYTATYTNEAGTIAADTTATADITNTKGTTVDTGIFTDNAPYIAMLLMVGAGIVAITRKRAMED